MYRETKLITSHMTSVENIDTGIVKKVKIIQKVEMRTTKNRLRFHHFCKVLEEKEKE